MGEIWRERGQVGLARAGEGLDELFWLGGGVDVWCFGIWGCGEWRR